MKSGAGAFSEYYQWLAEEGRADPFLPCSQGPARASANPTSAWRRSAYFDMVARCFGRSFSLAWLRPHLPAQRWTYWLMAAASFSATIQQQPEMLQSNPSPAEFAEKTIDYAVAKVGYFKALREELPELMGLPWAKEARPPELDTFAAAFAVAGENQEKVADEETLVLLKRFSRNPDVEKAKVELERTQKLEEKFHKDFDGVDFTGNRLPTCELSGPMAQTKAPNSP